jgi:CMP-N,N'-diacetyllegionaminic acid synthase
MINFCIIPARSGSKNIKKKNIKLFNKKPLLYWSIKAARQSNCFDKIHVSTDSLFIKNLAIKYGAEVPFLRKKKLSKDNSLMQDVVKYVMNVYKKKYNYYPDSVTILQPTSPLRDSKDIIKALRLFYKDKSDSLVSVVEISHYQYPNNLYRIRKNILVPVSKKNILKNRQKVKLKLFSRNGASIYITRGSKIKKYIVGGKISAYIMPLLKSLDINNNDDFILAELVQKKFKYNT